jgi:CheY-like chemotaxis protein
MPGDGYILVVEDDDDIREVIVEMLAERGYASRAAANGEEALVLLRSESQAPPCLILLDQSMPVMDGEALIEELGGIPALAAVPICVLTADVRYADDEVAAILTKPIDEGALMKVVRAHCGAA